MNNDRATQALAVFLAFWSLAPLWFANLLFQRGQYEFAAWLVGIPAAIVVTITVLILIMQAEDADPP